METAASLLRRYLPIILVTFFVIATTYFSLLLVRQEIHCKDEAWAIAKLVGAVDNMHDVLNAVVHETGETILHSVTKRNKAKMLESRTKTEQLVVEFERYLKTRLDELKHDNVLDLSMFIGLLDDMERHHIDFDSGKDIIGYYTVYLPKIREYANEFVRSMVLEVTRNEEASLLAVLSAWMCAQDYTGWMRDVIAEPLARGQVTAEALKKLVAKKGIRDEYILNALDTEHKLHLGQALQATPEAQKAHALVQSYIEKGAFSGDTASELKEWCESMNAYIQLQYELVGDLLEELQHITHAQSSHARFRSALSVLCVLLCVCYSLAMAVQLVGFMAKCQHLMETAGDGPPQLVQEGFTLDKLPKYNLKMGQVLSPQLLELFEIPEDKALQPGIQNTTPLTIVFGDVVNFDTLSKQSSHSEALKLIEAWLSGVSPLLERYHGVIHKVAGSGITAYFKKPDDAIKASLAAAEWSWDYNKLRKVSGGAPLMFGLACATGPGSLGTWIVKGRDRPETSIISQALDIAKSMDFYNARFRANVVVTDATVQGMTTNGHGFRFRMVGVMKGTCASTKHVAIYELVDACEDAVERQAREDTMEWHMKGVNAFEAKDYGMARGQFDRCLTRYPEDPGARYYKEEMKRR